MTLPDLKTTAEVSAITGQAARTIQIHAKRYGLGLRFGGILLFTEADIDRLREIRAKRAQAALKEAP